MADPGPSSAPTHAPTTGPAPAKSNPRARHQANLKKYGTPLPILLPTQPKRSTTSASSFSSYLPDFLLASTSKARAIEVPKCTGVYDAATRSVWVTDRRDAEILFRRGFFGKGTLSRSEPSWRERRMGLLKGGDLLLAEQVREKRRLERKQFKVERAAAMLDAAKTAEAVLVTGQAPSTPSAQQIEEGQGGLADDEALDESESVPGSPAPSTATSTTMVDVSNLTPQTFLVRPTRPDANRNRGSKAFKRRPPQAQKPNKGTSTGPGTDQPNQEVDVAPVVPRPRDPPPVSTINEVDDEAGKIEQDEEDKLIEELVQDMEHLQLSLEEAWFLSTALGVLRVYDPASQTLLQPAHVLSLFLTPLDPLAASPAIQLALRPDDPFLVSYVAYHHFRSIGWVVKPGIKFCADWLLYRRGPVFSHSAFAVVVIPVYGDESEQATSPYGNTDWYQEATSWKWMNTIMRVNSLVQKTVILAYVTIPALSSFPSSLRNGDGLDHKKNDMTSLLKRYTVREVAVTRFGPARRRD